MNTKLFLISFLVVAIFLGYSEKLFAQSNYYLLYDKTFSSKVGAEDLLTIHKAFYSFEDQYLPPVIFNEDKWNGKYLNIVYRASKNIIDYPAQVFLKLVDHEVFGHGARFSEFGFDDITYHFTYPYSTSSGGSFAVSWLSPHHRTSFDENALIDVGGVEANTIISEIIREKWVQDDSTNYNDFFLYIRAFHGITQYTYQTYHDHKIGDISDYVGTVSMRYPSKTQYTSLELYNYSFINIFDPFQFLAFYNWCGYIISGKTRAKLPMIKIGEVRYLPSFHMGLTPFGAEFYMDNYLKYHQTVLKIYGRTGDSRYADYWGGGVSAFDLMKNRYGYVHATLDFWNQPSLILHNENDYNSHLGSSGLGGCVSVTLGLNITKKLPASIVLIGGYKTDGFLPGETLAKGFFLRTGMAFRTR